jgi:hypothetical protein
VAAAGVAGLLFAVHPLQAECVAWFAGRTQLICGALMLGSALAHARLAVSTSRWRWLPGALFVAGWLAKPIVVTLPLVLLALDWFPLRRHATGGWWPLVREKLWMLALGAGLTLLTFRFAAGEHLVYTTEELGVWERVLLAVRAAVFYLWKLAWPAWLSPWYPLGGNIRLSNRDFYVALAVLAALCASACWSRKRCPTWTTAWWAYLALLLPVSGLTQFGMQSVANRHAYVAIIPLLLAAGAGAAWVFRRAPAWGRVGLAIIGVVVAGQLAVRARAASRMWHDDQTLWVNVLSCYPDFSYAVWKIVSVATARQDYSLALPCVEEICRRRPDDPELRSPAGCGGGGAR